MKDPAHSRAVGQLVAAALLWSFAGVLIKGIAWPPLAIAGGRGLIAALFLLATSRGLKFTWSRLQVGAALAYVACPVSFVVANRLTTAANAILLQYTAPVWVALLGAWFLGERATRADWWAIVVSFLGMGLFFADELRLAGVLGNLVGIFSGVCFAGVAILLRKQKDGSAVESIILGNLLAFVIGLPFIATAPALPGSGWVLLVLLGVVQLGLSYKLYSQAIRHVTALEAVLIPVVEPVFNPIWVLLFVGERPGPLALAGGAIVLGAVTLRAVASIRRTWPA